MITEKTRKEISFRTLKKNCKHIYYGVGINCCDEGGTCEYICCEKNCPVLKRLKDVKKIKDDVFNMAITLSLDIVFNVYDEPTMAYEILKSVGISIDDLIKYCKRVGAEYDLNNLIELKKKNQSNNRNVN